MPTENKWWRLSKYYSVDYVHTVNVDYTPSGKQSASSEFGFSLKLSKTADAPFTFQFKIETRSLSKLGLCDLRTN